MSTRLKAKREAKCETEDVIKKQFNVMPCCVKLRDVKLTKANYWRVYIDPLETLGLALPSEMRQPSSDSSTSTSSSSTVDDKNPKEIDKDSLDDSDQNEDKITTTTATVSTTVTRTNEQTANKYLVDNKMLTLNEIKDLAKRPFSELTLAKKSRQESESTELYNKLTSSECRDHLISIMKEKIKCNRHKKYLKANGLERRKMRFSSTGPLNVEHQQHLVQLLNKISEENFTTKPKHLTTYDYDVLYPEAVIWAIMKLDQISYKKAEFKYKKGFPRNEEEQLKFKCNLFLTQHNLNDPTNQIEPDEISAATTTATSSYSATDPYDMSQLTDDSTLDIDLNSSALQARNATINFSPNSEDNMTL